VLIYGKTSSTAIIHARMFREGNSSMPHRHHPSAERHENTSPFKQKLLPMLA
jgi:hypothetical protein